jgi:hypothetical protein
MIGRLALELRRAGDRLVGVGPRRLVSDHLRALRFHLGGPERFVANRDPRPERLVVTLSTTPARARHLAATLRSLIDQTVAPDRIVLALPRVCRRDGSAYPDPSTLRLPGGVDILPCDDDGPATKLLPALVVEPAACLVVVDDDVIYPPDFIETLLAAHRATPRAVVGYRGVTLGPGVAFGALRHVFATAVTARRPVDVLFGTWGYLVPPGALDAAVADFSGAPEAVRNVDDVWIAGHLARRGVARSVVPAPMYPIETVTTLRGSLTGGVNRSGENDRIAIAFFGDVWGTSKTGSDQRSGPC